MTEDTGSRESGKGVTIVPPAWAIFDRSNRELCAFVSAQANREKIEKQIVHLLGAAVSLEILIDGLWIGLRAFRR